jgi:Ankyrin repeats (3 copies)
MLRCLKEHGSVFEASNCAGAAAGGHQHVLQYLRDEGCEWDWSACSAAAKHGHLDVLKWLREQGCPWEWDEICGDAALSGSVEMLLYLQDQGCEYNEDTMIGAAMRGHRAVCEYLVAEQRPTDRYACQEAAENGHFEVVRFLHENGCPWEVENICSAAAGQGSIELLQYLKQQGRVFNVRAMRYAARGGHLHACQYLRAEQCPWDTMACHSAACEGHLSTLRWLREQGCPCEVPAMRTAAAFFGHLSVLRYLVDVEPAASAAQLTEMLNDAGRCNWLSIAQWLRQQGAEWPAVLGSQWRSWRTAALQWARDEGCTSPLYTEPATATAQP